MKVTKNYLRQIILEEMEKFEEVDSYTPLPNERDPYSGAGEYTEVEAVGYTPDGKGGLMWTFRHNGKKFNIKETAPNQIDYSGLPVEVSKKDIETAIANYRVTRRAR